MRDFKGMKRQRSRNRNGGGGGGGGGGKPQHNTNRAFDSNGPEGVKVRGAAQHVYEKYQQLARDAQTVGDRVLAENYLQHAEHYFRLMRAMQPQRPLSEIIGRDQFVSGYDIDFEDESGAEGGGEGEGEGDAVEAGAGEGQARQDSRPNTDYRGGEQRQRDDTSRPDRYQGDRPYQDRQNNDRQNYDRQNGERQGQGQDRQQRNDRPRDDRSARPYRDDRQRYDRDDAAPRVESADFPSAAFEAPTRVLRADDGETSAAPAFLQVRPAEPRAEGGDDVRKPRRRRAPASFEADAVDPAGVPSED